MVVTSPGADNGEVCRALRTLKTALSGPCEHLDIAPRPIRSKPYGKAKSEGQEVDI